MITYIYQSEHDKSVPDHYDINISSEISFLTGLPSRSISIDKYQDKKWESIYYKHFIGYSKLDLIEIAKDVIKTY